ncbi:MAG: hypothetical protein R3E95_09080 [Thiolinea sp.]
MAGGFAGWDWAINAAGALSAGSFEPETALGELTSEVHRLLLEIKQQEVGRVVTVEPDQMPVQKCTSACC